MEKLKKINQSQIGMFIKLTEDVKPLEEFSSLDELANFISIDFSVDCKAEDIKNFMELDNNLLNENYELESKKVYYGI